MSLRAITTISLLTVLTGCAKAAQALTPTELPPSHRAVVCDASSSGRGASCTPATLAKVVRDWARAVVDQPRSTLVVVRAGRRRSDAEVLLRASVPASWGPGLRARQMAWRRGVTGALPASLGAGAGSAVIEAAQVAWGMLPTDGARALTLLSDLREVTEDRAYNMERRVPSASRFLAWISRSGLRLDLRGALVEVCGLHHRTAPEGRRFGARQDRSLRALWETVFRDAGAAEVRLDAQCAEGPVAARLP